MKIAVFSDIHGNYQALKAILKRIDKKKYDKVIFLGDAIGLGPDGLMCAKRIQESDIIYLLGNHELYYTRGYKIDDDIQGEEIKHHEWVTDSLKNYEIKDDNNLRYDLEINNIKLSFFHYFLNNKKYPFEHLDILQDDKYKEVYNKEKANYIFFGHNHKETYNEINNKYYYGIGSSGCNTSNKTYYYEIKIDNTVKVKRIELQYKRNKFNHRIRHLKYPEKEKLMSIFWGM